jgi:hypothetical protein
MRTLVLIIYIYIAQCLVVGFGMLLYSRVQEFKGQKAHYRFLGLLDIYKDSDNAATFVLLWPFIIIYAGILLLLKGINNSINFVAKGIAARSETTKE